MLWTLKFLSNFDFKIEIKHTLNCTNFQSSPHAYISVVFKMFHFLISQIPMGVWPPTPLTMINYKTIKYLNC